MKTQIILGNKALTQVYNTLAIHNWIVNLLPVSQRLQNQGNSSKKPKETGPSLDLKARAE